MDIDRLQLTIDSINVIVQAIESKVEVLLLDDNSTNSLKIEDLLDKFKVYRFKLDNFLAVEKAGEFLQDCRPDFILSTIDLSQNNSLSILSRLQAYNTHHIPLIPVLSKNSKIDILPENIAKYLSWEEISSDLPSKAIWLAFKQERHRLETVERENEELDSQLIATKNLFSAIVDSTSTLIWMCDASGNSTFFNRAWSKLFGQNVTIASHNWMLNVHNDDLLRCQHQFKRALGKGTGFTIDYRLEKSDRQECWISNYAVPLFTVNGEFGGLVGYCFDITARKQTEYKLMQKAASDRLLAQITRKIHASLELEQILETTVIELNQFLQADKIQIDRVDDQSQLTLLFESKLVGQTTSCNISDVRQIPQKLFEANTAYLSAGQIIFDEDVDLVKPNNNSSIILFPIVCKQKLWGVLCIEQYSTRRKLETEEIELVERVALELSVAIFQASLYQQLEEANRELEKLSIVDSLTKIANRRKFDSYLAAEWKRSLREQTPLSLILCDIDHFKLYNDTYGHQKGDRCLEQVAGAINKVFKRPADLVARYGGEEFAVILPNTPLKGAEYLAQQIRWRINALKIPHIASNTDLYLTLSLGVSCCIPELQKDFESLVATADRSLYRAKELGRNRVVALEFESK